MKHVFVINPVAGKGKAKEYVDIIDKIFLKREDEYEIFLTERIGHATELVREKVKEQKCFVYSIGGDGTLNEVLNGIIGSESVLAVIPSGSGNDFARTIYSKEINKEFIEGTVNGKIVPIDVGVLNNRYFLNISSIGFDAVVADNVKEFKRKPIISGSMAYLFSVFKTLFTFKPLEITYEVDGEVFIGSMYLVAIANGKCYGGGIKIAPLAQVTDGQFDVYAIKKPKLHRLMKYLPMVIMGEDISHIEEVHFKKCKNFKIKCNKEAIINIDGELLYDKELEFSIISKGVNLLVPKEIEI